MQPSAVPPSPFPFGQQAPTRILARRGRVGCLHQLRGCVIVLVALAVVVIGGLWVLSAVFHAPLQVYVNPLPYINQYKFVVHHGQTQVYVVAWSRDGKRVASASSEQDTVQVWDAASGRTQFTYQAQRGQSVSLAWSPDGTRLALADVAHALVMLDAATGRTIFGVASAPGQPSVSWSPDGQRIAVVNQTDNRSNGEVRDAASGHVLATFPGVDGEVAWSPDGKELAATSSSQDSDVLVWEVASGNVLLSHTRKSVFDAAYWLEWSPDSRRIAAEVYAMDQRREQVWDVASGHTVFTYTASQDTSGDLVAAWSPDSQRIAIGGEIGDSVAIWNVATGNQMLTYGGHGIASFARENHTRAGVLALAWSPDGERIVSLGIEETVQIWDAAKASPLYVYDTNTDLSLFNGGYATNGARAVAWSPDGRRVAIGGDNFAEVWQPA